MPRVKITPPVFGREDTGVAVLLDGASVQVNDSDGNAATVYEAATGGTTISNPITSDNGELPGFLNEGLYSLVPTYDGVTGDAMPFEARAAYPSGASDGDVLAFDGDTSEVVWTNPGEVSGALPWTIDINPFTTPATQTNWSTTGTAASQYGGFVRQSSSAQNAEIGWDVVLAEGTWTLSLFSFKADNSGIYTASLDGVSAGTVDGYASSASYNQVLTITGITVSATGKKRLLLKMATKNGSSSSYLGALSSVRLLRTA